MVVISKIIYLGETKILLRTGYDREVSGLVKSIPGSRYTSTFKGWHIPYDKLHWNLFLALGCHIGSNIPEPLTVLGP